MKSWRRGRVRGRILVTVMALGAVSVAACSSGGSGSTSGSKPADAGAPVSGGTLTVGSFTDPVQLNPILQPNGISDALITSLVEDPIFNLNPQTFQTEPGLGLSYKANAADTVFTVKLRQGVKFSDGEAFNSAAVVYQFKQELNPANASPALPLLAPIKSVTADGPYQVSFTLSHPWATFPQDVLAWTTSYIAAPGAEQRDGLTGFGKHPVGTGRFTFASWERGVQITLQQNPHYWGKAPYLNSIVIKSIEDETTRLQSLEAGDLDVMVSLQSTSVALAKRAGQQVLVTPAPQSWNIYLNNRSGPLANPAVRSALAYATNRQEISSLIFDNVEPPASRPFLPNSPFVQGIDFPAYNLAKAKQLMSQYKGAPITVDLAYDGGPQGAQEADLIKQMWKAIGVTVVPESQTPPQFNQSVTVNHDFQAALSAVANYRSAPEGMCALFCTNGTENPGGYSNPQVDQALTAAEASADPNVQLSDIRSALKVVAADNPQIFLAYEYGAIISATDVHGVVVSPLASIVPDITYAWKS